MGLVDAMSSVFRSACCGSRPAILGLCGLAGSGKDTAAEALVDDGWVRVAFADAIREGLLAIDPIVGSGADCVCWRISDYVESGGWDGAKRNPEVRFLLQRYGTEGGREVHGDDCWLNIGRRKIVEALAAGKCVVVTDVRFANEAELIHELGGQVVKVLRPSSGLSGSNSAHASERLDFVSDRVLVNDSTISSLHERIRRVAALGRPG